MKHLHVSALALMFALCAAPAFAQHGHEGGATGGAMGGTLGHGAADHGNAGNATSPNTSRPRPTIDEQLAKNKQVSSQIQKLTGMSASQACGGFKNLGQCVAAAHVSKNLGINFDCLRSDMTKQTFAATSACPSGTGKKAMSLGRAIQTLDPTVNSKTEAQKGMEQANQDLKQSNAS